MPKVPPINIKQISKTEKKREGRRVAKKEEKEREGAGGKDSEDTPRSK